MPATNPFSRGYAAITAALRAFPPFMALVKTANLWDEQGYGGSVPNRPVNATERPEVRLMERRLILRPLDANSRHVLLQQAYPLQIATASYAPDKANLLAIVCAQALTSAGPTLGPATADIVYKWELLPGTMEQLDPQTRRPEWSAACDILVHFALTREAFLQTVFT